MDVNKIRRREEIPEEFTWNLKDIFESDEAWMAEYEALRGLPEQVLAYRGRLGESAEMLLSFLREQDALHLRLSALFGYAHAKSDQDTGNGFYQDMLGKAMSTYVAISSAAAFAAPEIMAIPEERLNLFRIVQPGLEEYSRSLYRIRRRAAHILSPAVEQLLSAGEEMSGAAEKGSGVAREAEV